MATKNVDITIKVNTKPLYTQDFFNRWPHGQQRNPMRLEKLTFNDQGNLYCPVCKRENVFLDYAAYQTGLQCYICGNYWQFPLNFIVPRPMRLDVSNMIINIVDPITGKKHQVRWK